MRIALENLSKAFQHPNGAVTQVFAPLTFQIEGSTFVSLVGPSGCGKSTLLNIIAGLEAPTAGQVTVDGRPIGSDRGRSLRVGYVFQNPRLLNWLTVAGNIEFALEATGVSRERWRALVDQYIGLVGLRGTEDHFPLHLSGGMQQRVGIARAFSIEPDVLFMDEPFSHLDAITARSLRRELHEMWRQTRKTVLFVTHDVGEAVELSNRILVFAKGGRLEDDLQIDLPFPRDPSNEDVAIAKAQVLKKFEELDLVAT